MAGEIESSAVSQLHIISLGGSATVIAFFTLRAVIHYARAGEKLSQCIRIGAYLVASLDENREPDLRYDTIQVSKRLKELQAHLRTSGTEAAKLLRFRRDMLEDGRYILDNMERARSSTEILPLCGVLGTAVGFLMTSYLGSGQTAVDKGLWLALISTILALAATIFLKWAFEGRLVPQYAHFRDQNETLERCIREGGVDRLEALPAEPVDLAQPAEEP